MKWIAGALMLAVLINAGELWAASIKAPAELAVGQPAIVTVEGAPATGDLRLLFQERGFYLNRLPGGAYVGVIAADLKMAPGRYRLELSDNGVALARAEVLVKDRDYGTRNITVEQKYVEPDADTLERINWENERQLKVYNTPNGQRYWSGAFMPPLNSAVVGNFGRKSVINGEPRSPHGGVDLRGAVGVAVKAPAAGRVALTMDSYFSGNMVLIDHGQGLVSGYRHLSEIMVSTGQMLQRGQTVGLVGATGRVTGPHLHFDIRLMGAVVDPLAFIELTKTLNKAANK